MTLLLFPPLYLTLELPKRIINDAIGSSSDHIEFFGITFGQVTFLMCLCVLFLLAVLVHGLMKMRINTMKGVLSERMLRRLRYQLITRLFRFPKPFYQRTSQAEIVSMVTGESEPLGGMMGDAISQPVMQAGQMLTILVFLFLQSFWFGLAAIAMIPFQAWLIPMLQRQVNLLNKKRVRELRKLAGEIGETAAGSTALRTSGGYRFKSAQITHRLGVLFFIRLSIYRKKFFMKFLNNFLTQLTPFFFFSIGGYLVILGHVSIGALVAALAAYKDLSSPWKELLAYYTRAHEMSQRWSLITERFAPGGAINATLITEYPEEIEQLTGDIVFDRVSAMDSDGVAVVKDISMTLPQGGLIAIAAPNEEDRRVMAELLTREMLPASGTITIGERSLNDIHQSVISTRIGWADSAPYLFAGTIGYNLLLALSPFPKDGISDQKLNRLEAIKSGNSSDLVDDNWRTVEVEDLEDMATVHSWWLKVIEAIGAEREVLRRGMMLHTTTRHTPDLTSAVISIRDAVAQELKTRDLTDTIVHFDQSAYCTAVPLLQNILFAAPSQSLTQRELADHPDFLHLLKETDLLPDVLALANSIIDTLFTTFGSDGTDHPLFQRLGIDVATFNQTLKLHEISAHRGPSALSDSDLALILALPCLLKPEHIGQVVSSDLREKIVGLRVRHPNVLSGHLSDYFQPLSTDTFSDGLSLMENAVFGVIKTGIGQRKDILTDVVIELLIARRLKAELAALTLDEETTFGGANLPRNVAERIGFTRALIKRPDIFVLDKVLGSYDDETRFNASLRLRQEMPNATIIYLEDAFRYPENFDLYVELSQGKITQGALEHSNTKDDLLQEPDLATKLQALEKTAFFANLERRQLRLLAFSAKWFNIKAGDVVFNKDDDAADGAYLLQTGEADFTAPQEDGTEQHIRTLGPGALVGELALIMKEPRTLTMRARSDISGLRIGGEEFLTVLQNDPQAAFKMLQVITRYLTKA